jgi:hypothetical protein
LRNSGSHGTCIVDASFYQRINTVKVFGKLYLGDSGRRRRLVGLRLATLYGDEPDRELGSHPLIDLAVHVNVVGDVVPGIEVIEEGPVSVGEFGHGLAPGGEETMPPQDDGRPTVVVHGLERVQGDQVFHLGDFVTVKINGLIQVTEGRVGDHHVHRLLLGTLGSAHQVLSVLGGHVKALGL